MGLVLGMTVPLVAFRMFTPDDLVPVKYKKGKTAHLDVTGQRGEAIRNAVREQLGLAVEEIKPVGSKDRVARPRCDCRSPVRPIPTYLQSCMR